MLTVGVGSFAVASAAYLGLFALLLAGWISRHWAIAGLITATFFWAALGCWVALGGNDAHPVYGILDFLRSTALLFLVNDALHRLSGGTKDGHHPNRGGMLVPVAGVIALALGILQLSGTGNAIFFGLIGQVGLAVIGLFLIENLYQASRPNALWSTKHLLIGAGTIFAYDLFFYTDALLLLRVDSTFRAAQPIIAVLAVPLILVSARRLNEISINLPVSRGLLVSTTALLASGTYILCVAAIAYLIRGLGWTWGPTLQLIFLIGAAMVLVVLLSSTSLRHGGRRFIERNLFTFAYDYRREWLRLVESMAATNDDLSLDQRALKAATTLMDADGAVLFLRGPSGQFQYKTGLNVVLDGRAPATPPVSLLAALSPERTAVVFGQAETMPAGLEHQTEVARWLAAFRGSWIALALLAQNELVGVILITRPRMQRRLSWEDLDLLSIFSHQLGSYLTVEQLARHVAEAEHFDRMSKHVTFVAHDLKNVISQLSLVLQQATHHAHNPAFVSDTFLTIGDAVERMKRLMQRVQQGADQTPLTAVDLSALVKDLEARGQCDGLSGWCENLVVKADASVLSALLDHIIDNARGAYEADPAADVSVMIALRQEGDTAVIEVIDQGRGMTRAFVETELFKPFTSTKQTGFGIGMYQCRDWIERWLGRLDVESEPGRGTTVRMVLPLAQASYSEQADAEGSAGKGGEEAGNAKDMPSAAERAA